MLLELEIWQAAGLWHRRGLSDGHVAFYDFQLLSIYFGGF